MEIFIILVLIVLNGVFSMSEIAVVSARKSRLEAAARSGNKSARRALELAENPNRFLSTVQIGITLIGIFTGIYSGEKITDDVTLLLNRMEVLRPYSESLSVTVVLILVTYFSLVIGELLPKRIGLTRPEGIAMAMSKPMGWLSAVTSPFIWVLSKSTDLLITVMGIRKTKDGEVTEEEIRAIIQEGTASGAIEEIEQDIVENVFHLGERQISSLMTQRMNIVWLDMNSPAEEVRSKIAEHPHKLYPVCYGDLDHVKGVLFIKDILVAALSGKQLDISALVRKPVFLPDSTKAYRALEEMRNRQASVALVINEYGGVQGLLTVNDIVDTLVTDFSGDMYEENEIVKRPDGSFLVDASLPLHEFDRYFELDINEDLLQQYNTLGGLIMGEARKLPEAGFVLRWNGLTIEVVDLDGMRIDKVIVTRMDKLEG